MERLAGDPTDFMLRLEFALHAARNPELSEAFAARAGAIRLLIERVLNEHSARTKTNYPLPLDELALVIRALGIGLAVERLYEPGRGRDELFGDFLAILLDLMEGRKPQPPRSRRVDDRKRRRAASNTRRDANR
jgi:hypothetical protein